MRLLICICILCPTFLIGQNQWHYSRSTLTWKGYGEIGGFFQEGTIGIKHVELEWEGDLPKSGNIIIDMKSIHHEDKALKKHLYQKDFFNVKRFPEANFQITSIDDKSMNGILTMCGQSHPVVIHYVIEKKSGVLKFTGQSEIDRTVFGIKYNSSSFFQDLGSYAIKNKFDLNFEISFEQ